MNIGDNVVVKKNGYGVCGKVLKFTKKRILVRTNFAPEENVKASWGNKFPVAQYYKPENVEIRNEKS
tara:strand:+ start:125 stop:325 length:201 start_codon:yes stop_codon:yes gene_type:complete